MCLLVRQQPLRAILKGRKEYNMQYIINTFKLRQRGERGYEITMPKSWIEQNKLVYGDEIQLSIDTLNPTNLLLTPVK